MTSLHSIYEGKRQFHQSEVDRRNSTIRKLVGGRILSALGFVAAFYGAFNLNFLFYLLPIIAGLFLWLVARYVKETEARDLAKRMVQLNELELKALDFDFLGFDDGERYKDDHHSFSYDLDLFGKGSLFQYLNRTASQTGEQQLSRDLLIGKTKKEEIEERQQAVKELGQHLDLRQQLWATGKETAWKKVEMDSMFQWLNEPDWIRGNTKFLLLRWGLPAITVPITIYTFYLIFARFDFTFLVAFMAAFSIQAGIISMFGGRVTKVMLALTNYRDRLENYSKLFQLFRQTSFHTSLLKKHSTLASDAFGEVKKFAQLVNRLESRMNPIAMGFGNGIFALDLHSVAALEEWRAKNGKALPQWLDSLAEWDALNSLAHFHYTHPNNVFPVFTEQFSIQATQLGHPLIPNTIRVNNDFVLRASPQVMIITGANMAGKSTFLRAVGVNFVLSLAGAPVCATKWEGPIAALRSGMRTTDSLQDHQSYFYAELARLQSIVEELKGGKKMLVLLDEILKGTNSDDKQAGSRELIQQLINLPTLVLLATHDVVLGAMANETPDRISATCFESEIKNDGLHFDYRLKQGVAKTRNATYLMRQMGILPK
jgi:hypothetical protein